ncbi:MAG: hypothetical protein JRI23_05230 [Deltaproteobacteria bacterium]|jgi:hypothetical protein|nr:hypothetical protein [Deltaproteobacteria bacterium]MBW2530954.1 hypothetical protein [Deltaproteobacteria bacterium]
MTKEILGILALTLTLWLGCSDDQADGPFGASTAAGGTGGVAGTGGGGAPAGVGGSGGGGSSATGTGSGSGGGATGGMGGTLACTGGAGGAGWNPSQLSGLNLWLEASTCVFTNGSHVTTWFDLSGNGNHATQNVSDERPVLTPSAINGLPAVDFDGVDDSLVIADHPTLDPQLDSYLCVAVGQFLSGSGSFGVWSGKASNTVGSNWRFFHTNFNQLQLSFDDTGLYVRSQGAVAGQTDTIVGWGVDTNSSEVLYVVGSTIERQSISVGAVMSNDLHARLGMDGGQEWAANIRIAEHLFYVRAGTGFPNADIQQLIDYFETKYGLGS